MLSAAALSKRYVSYTEQVLKRRARDLDLYRSALATRVRPGQRVLHLGCGWDRSSVTANLRPSVDVVGVDLDRSAGARYHSQCWIADAAKLPFADSAFDIVCSEYVFEHLSDPRAVAAELARVLRPGGSIIALTPNRWSYKSVAAALTPHWFHRVSAARLRPDARAAEDVYPTYYRMNTQASLAKLADSVGLTVEQVDFINNGPTWFRHLPGLFELGRAYHRALDDKKLRQLRCGILVVLTKSGVDRCEEPGGLAVRCISCGMGRMEESPDGFRCPRCAGRYLRSGNLVEVLS